MLVVRNTDGVVHDLVLDSGATSGRLTAGTTGRIEVGVVGRDMDGWCSVAGHRQMGMVLEIVARGAAAATTAALDGDPSGDGMPGHDMAGGPGPSAAEDLDLMAAPTPGFTAYDPVLAPASSATVHEVTLRVVEAVREVAPGVTQRLWTFGGSAPGPTLRGKVGDTLRDHAGQRRDARALDRLPRRCARPGRADAHHRRRASR